MKQLKDPMCCPHGKPKMVLSPKKGMLIFKLKPGRKLVLKRKRK